MVLLVFYCYAQIMMVLPADLICESHWPMEYGFPKLWFIFHSLVTQKNVLLRSKICWISDWKYTTISTKIMPNWIKSLKLQSHTLMISKCANSSLEFPSFASHSNDQMEISLNFGKINCVPNGKFHFNEREIIMVSRFVFRPIICHFVCYLLVATSFVGFSVISSIPFLFSMSHR